MRNLGFYYLTPFCGREIIVRVPTTSIRFELPRDKAVSLTIFDVSGRIVKTLVDNQHMAEGAHEMQWDGTNDAGSSVASGTYLYRLQFGNFAHTKTMVLLK